MQLAHILIVIIVPNSQANKSILSAAAAAALHRLLFNLNQIVYMHKLIRHCQYQLN